MFLFYFNTVQYDVIEINYENGQIWIIRIFFVKLQNSTETNAIESSENMILIVLIKDVYNTFFPLVRRSHVKLNKTVRPWQIISTYWPIVWTYTAFNMKRDFWFVWNFEFVIVISRSLQEFFEFGFCLFHSLFFWSWWSCYRWIQQFPKFWFSVSFSPLIHW